MFLAWATGVGEGPHILGSAERQSGKNLKAISKWWSTKLLIVKKKHYKHIAGPDFVVTSLSKMSH